MEETLHQALKKFKIDVDTLSKEEVEALPKSIEEIREAQRYNMLLELGFSPEDMTKRGIL